MYLQVDRKTSSWTQVYLSLMEEPFQALEKSCCIFTEELGTGEEAF